MQISHNPFICFLQYYAQGSQAYYSGKSFIKMTMNKFTNINVTNKSTAKQQQMVSVQYIQIIHSLYTLWSSNSCNDCSRKCKPSVRIQHHQYTPGLSTIYPQNSFPGIWNNEIKITASNTFNFQYKKCKIVRSIKNIIYYHNTICFHSRDLSSHL